MAEKKLEGAGLRGQVAGHTALSTVGKAGKGLTYRGYAIEDLAKHKSFSEVSYLLIYGELPSKKQLNEFEKNSGVPVLINTSLNLPREPMVNSIQDGLKTFFSSEIDYLCIGDYLITKDWLGHII